MGDYYRLGRLCPFLTRLGRICLSRNRQILPSHPYPEMSSRRRGRQVGVEGGCREHGGRTMFWFGKAGSDVHALIPWVADYAYGELPRNMPFLYVWFVVNSGETSKRSIPGEQPWVGM